MFRSVLIANRGEIACRIARTARRMGLHTIGVYSAADRQALHVRHCDVAVPIGRADARDSYLSIDRLIEAATANGAECIHPGYGFLAENPDFAEACAQAGIAFVGPSAAAIRAMGLKDAAKTLMERAGVPIVPGYHGKRQDLKFLQGKAEAIGYPILIKPSAGGGGRGLRRVDNPSNFADALAAARREAEAGFGSGRVLIEKYVAAPRHIEIQVFGDVHGNIIHLGERDCSLQRRHQKVIEEAPAPGMSAALRARMGAAASEAARAGGACGAGTGEFVADGSRGLREDAFWFIEMNTRLQVEHPVTEVITGLDLVEWQFRVAAGERLPLRQDQIRFAGHAVEARIYAEEPRHGFRPSTGAVVAVRWPSGVRVETGIAAGSAITSFYDPMVAKLIANGDTRDDALDGLVRALDDAVIAGPSTNINLLAALLQAAEFRGGTFDTGYVDRHLGELAGAAAAFDAAAAACGVAHLLDAQHSHEQTAAGPQSAIRNGSPDWPWAARDGFQLGGPRVLSLPIVADGEQATAIVSYPGGTMQVAVNGAGPAADAQAFVAEGQAYVIRRGLQTRVRLPDFTAAAAASGAGDGVIRAPMHGRLLQVLVKPGDRVNAGERLAVLEAMKMEHTLHAPFSGTVREVRVASGAQLVEGGEIMLIEPGEAR